MIRQLQDSAFARLLFQALARRGLKAAPSEAGKRKRTVPVEATQQTEPDGGAYIQSSHRVRTGTRLRKHHRNRKATAPRGHVHLELKHAAVPHPRYGDKVPHFRTWREYAECTCDDARVTSSIKRRLRREARMRLQPAVVDASASSSAPGTSGTVQQQCARTTKLGTRCSRKAAEGSDLCTQHGTVDLKANTTYLFSRGA